MATKRAKRAAPKRATKKKATRTRPKKRTPSPARKRAKAATTRRASMPPDVASVFMRLRGILRQFEGSMVVKHDKPGNYYLDTRVETPRGPLFFGSVETKKAYVSFHLFPVYMFPDLLQGISSALKKRMQGKSCFNFVTVDEALFDELAGLTSRGAAELESGRRPDDC
jgi:hypothetical protein